MILQEVVFVFADNNFTKAEVLVYNVLDIATDARKRLYVITKTPTEIPMGAALLLC